MKRLISWMLIGTLSLTSAGCATTNGGQPAGAGESAGIGALIGAAGGALIGAAVGGKKGAATGALVGAAVGGVTGFVVGSYREREYKSAQQIYKENPAYAKKSAANDPPQIKNVKPYIKDGTGKVVTTVKNGQSITLCTNYDILIPRYADYKTVDVVETNYLIDPKGNAMNRETLTRTKSRPVKGISAEQDLTLPKGLPDGTYEHIAIVSVNEHQYQAKQKLRVVRTEDGSYSIALVESNTFEPVLLELVN